MNAFDFVDDGLVFFRFGAVNQVRLANALHRTVRRNREHVEFVNLPKLARFGHRGTGHPADFVVKFEEVLQRDRRQRAVFFLDANAFLRFDRLVQTVAPGAPFHQTSGEVVDDDDFAVFNDVVNVALIKVARFQGVVDQVRPVHVPDRVEALDAGQTFGAADAFVGQVRRVVFFVDLKVDVFHQLRREAVGGDVLRQVVARRAGDDERRPRFVDENVVDFVDNGVVQAPLRLLRVRREIRVGATGVTHVVAQVVEAELVVRAVGNVARVSLLAVGGRHVALNRTDRQTERHIQRPHPLHVAAREVVVDRNDVDALPFERVEVRRKGRDERFPFAGHHFGDLPFVKRASADHLHVVVAQAQDAAPGFAADGERFFEQVVERLSGREAFAEEKRLLAQLLVAHRLIFRLEPVDRFDARLNFLQRPRVRRTEQRRDFIFHPTRDAAEKIADALKGILQIHY